MIVVSIDPDIRAAAASIFVDDVLRAAGTAKSPLKQGPHDVATCLAQALRLKQWIMSSLFELGLWHVHTPDVFVYEWPRILLAGHQKGRKKGVDPNNMLPLTGVDVGLAALYPNAEHVTLRPDEWKGGNIDKKVMCERVWRRLAPVEKSVVERRPRGGGLEIDGEKGLSDDVLDSIGVGLRHLGRLERIRVFD